MRRFKWEKPGAVVKSCQRCNAEFQAKSRKQKYCQKCPDLPEFFGQMTNGERGQFYSRGQIPRRFKPKKELPKCRKCGKEFKAYRRSQKYCSHSCSMEVIIKGEFKPCDICGNPVWRTPSQNSKLVICSHKCNGERKSRQSVNRIIQHVRRFKRAMRREYGKPDEWAVKQLARLREKVRRSQLDKWDLKCEIWVSGIVNRPTRKRSVAVYNPTSWEEKLIRLKNKATRHRQFARDKWIKWAQNKVSSQTKRMRKKYERNKTDNQGSPGNDSRPTVQMCFDWN